MANEPHQYIRALMEELWLLRIKETSSSAAAFAAFQAGFTVNQDFSVSNLFHDLFSYLFFYYFSLIEVSLSF